MISMNRTLMRIARTVVSGTLCFFAAATTALPQSQTLSTEEMTKKADVVAIGKVREVHAEWTPGKSRIISRVTIAVDQYLKGNDPSGQMTLTVPGGEIDGVGELYSHSTSFRQDEDVVVFARRDAQGAYRVAAGRQGKVVIDKDKETGQLTVGGTRTLQEYATAVRRAVQLQEKK
jgi:hypothetical protein